MKKLLLLFALGVVIFSCKKDEDSPTCVDVAITQGVATKSDDGDNQIEVVIDDDCLFLTPENLPAGTAVEPFLIGTMSNWYKTNSPIGLPDLKRKQEGEIWAETISAKPHYLSITGRINWTKKSTYAGGVLTGVGEGDGWKSVKLTFSDTSNTITWNGKAYTRNWLKHYLIDLRLKENYKFL